MRWPELQRQHVLINVKQVDRAPKQMPPLPLPPLGCVGIENHNEQLLRRQLKSARGLLQSFQSKAWREFCEQGAQGMLATSNASSPFCTSVDWENLRPQSDLDSLEHLNHYRGIEPPPLQPRIDMDSLEHPNHCQGGEPQSRHPRAIARTHISGAHTARDRMVLREHMEGPGSTGAFLAPTLHMAAMQPQERPPLPTRRNHTCNEKAATGKSFFLSDLDQTGEERTLVPRLPWRV
jgi:hypothetical protein